MSLLGNSWTAYDAGGDIKVAVCIAHESRNVASRWYGLCGSESGECDASGLMFHRHAGVKDLPAAESVRKFSWSPGPRRDDHSGLFRLSFSTPGPQSNHLTDVIGQSRPLNSANQDPSASSGNGTAPLQLDTAGLERKIP